MAASVIRHSCFLYIALLLIAISPAQARDQTDGLLWRISGLGNNVSYVLGTIHSDSPRVTRIPAEIKKIFAQSRSFTAELDMDIASLLQAQTQMLLPPDKALSSIIGAARFQQCVSLLADYGIPEVAIARMKPWAIAVQLSMPRPTTGVFLDLELFQQAQAKGMKTYGLETVEEQMSTFETLTQPQQILMLDDAIQNHKRLPAMIDTLIGLYLQRNLEGMEQYSKKMMQEGNPALADIMQDKLIVKRNHRMVNRMQARLSEGGAFIAVGALHLPGENGILKLLQRAGYRVEPVY